MWFAGIVSTGKSLTKSELGMTRALNRMSVAELENVLEKQRALLSDLTNRRQSLVTELRDLDKQIGKLEGKRGRGRKAAATGTKRIRGQRSLKSLLVEILSKYKKGLTKQELVDKVTASGYKSNSKNFGMIVYLNLYKKPEFHVDEKGIYTYQPQA